MRTLLKDRRVRWLALIVAGLLNIAAGYNGVRSVGDQREVKKMIATMKTVCFGRFLVDLPADATVSWGGPFINGWTIDSLEDETDEQFNDRLVKNESELALKENQKGLKSLETTFTIDNEHIHGKIFIFGRKWRSDLENGVRVDDDYASGAGYFRLGRLSLDLSQRIVFSEDGPALAKLVSQFTPLDDGEIPVGPGFCFGPAMIGDPLRAKQGERVTMFVGIKDHPDISIVFNTIAGLKQGESLLERAAKIKEKYAHAVTDLRSGPRKIGGLAGEELLQRVRERSGVVSHDFNWEAFRRPDDVFHPLLNIELGSGYGRAGEQLNSSLTDTAIIALWDKITSSLRVRPTQPLAAPTSTPTPAPAVPATTSAHQPCPATGWWHCDDGGDGIDVVSGSTQFFRAGQQMPQARLTVPTNRWQRLLRGQPPTFERAAATRWTLIDAMLPAPTNPEPPPSLFNPTPPEEA